jgi:hypothetical protein
MKTKVKSIDSERIFFENGWKLYSNHNRNCCESHYLSFEDLLISDFDGLLFDLEGDRWFGKIEGYGIELIPLDGKWPVKIPGYAYNNGYYSDTLELVLETDTGEQFVFDITDCQENEYNY